MVDHSRLPNLLIVGVGKCGTSSLFDYLAQHPDICAANVKETYFFAPLMLKGGELPPFSAYQRFFNGCSNQVYRMEGTPVYAAGGSRLREAIRDSLPEARFLICLRDPVARLWSQFRWLQGRNSIVPMIDSDPSPARAWRISRSAIPPRMTFEDYVRRCLEVYRTGTESKEENVYFRGVSVSRFGEYVPAWLDMFGERVQVVFSEYLRSDPRATVEDILRWLNLDPDPAAEMDYTPVNVTARLRSRSVRRTADFVYGIFRRPLNKRPGVKAFLASGYRRTNHISDGATMSGSTRHWLDALFQEDKDQLRETLQNYGYSRFPAWLATDSRDDLHPDAEGSPGG